MTHTRELHLDRFSALGVETGFLTIERGKDIPKDEFDIGKSLVEDSCRSILRDIGIIPLGDTLPCCSAAAKVKNMRLGNANEKGLQQLVEEAKGRRLFRVLMLRGPGAIIEALGSDDEYDYVNRCHLCYEVVRHPHLQEALEVL